MTKCTSANCGVNGMRGIRDRSTYYLGLRDRPGEQETFISHSNPARLRIAANGNVGVRREQEIKAGALSLALWVDKRLEV